MTEEMIKQKYNRYQMLDDNEELDEEYESGSECEIDPLDDSSENLSDDCSVSSDDEIKDSDTDESTELIDAII